LVLKHAVSFPALIGHHKTFAISSGGSEVIENRLPAEIRFSEVVIPNQ
jgi:hypothetical protein